MSSSGQNEVLEEAARYEQMEQPCNHKSNGFQFIQHGTKKWTLEGPNNHPVHASVAAETNGRPIYTTNQQTKLYLQHIISIKNRAMDYRLKDHSSYRRKKQSSFNHLANPQQKGPEKIKKLSVGDSWKRDAQDEQQTANLLQQEVQQLQAKVQRSIEESERLRRLSLELQFQKSLEEFQNGDENVDDDDESNSGAEQTWFQTG
ncbi:hypothetical protein M9458_034182, partial [Cirrhinus mrigala]